MDNTTYSLPSKLSQEAKLFRFLTIRTVITMFLFAFLSIRVSSQVFEPLQVPFIIFNVVVGLYVSIISKKNMQKRNYQSFLIFIFRDRHFYKPISPQSKLPDTMKKYNEYERRMTYLEPEDI